MRVYRLSIVLNDQFGRTLLLFRYYRFATIARFATELVADR